MKFIELREALELEIDQLDSNLTKPTTSDMEYWFMAGLDKLIKTRYTGNNYKRQGFEEVQKRIDDLRTLVSQKTYAFQVYPERYSIELPADYMFTLGETAVIFSDIDPCWPKGPNGMPRTKTTDVSEATIENIDRKRENSLSEYRLQGNSAKPLRLFQGNQILLETDGNYSIKEYRLTYLRQPKKIDLTTAPFEEYSDMPKHMHQELVKVTAQLYLENKANPRYQTYMNEVNTME